MVRYVPNEREKFFEICKEKLEKQSRNFFVILGSWEKRWDRALEAVQQQFVFVQDDLDNQK